MKYVPGIPCEGMIIPVQATRQVHHSAARRTGALLARNNLREQQK